MSGLKSTIADLYAAADAARAGNRPSEAAGYLERILALDADQPRALNSLGMRMLASGDPARAVALFSRAVRVDPKAIELRLNLADAQRQAGNDEGELGTLDSVLAIEPYQLMALVRKAQNRERAGNQTAAARVYAAVLSIVGSAKLPPALEIAIEHGRQVIASEQSALAEAIAPFLTDARRNIGGAGAPRFDRCLDVLLGRASIYQSTPTGLHYPGLPTIEFFEREAFDWLPRLEAATPVVQQELAGLTTTIDSFAPYVDFPSGSPVNQWGALNRSLDWSALFLWKDGVRVEENCARCPRTAALLAELPLLDMPGRGPAAFFSVLKAGSHIPPHVGVTNIRTVVHLPLVVPPGCAIRVGSTVREWQIGTALAFDDTIEHEAWNRSGESRAVLIVDAWNPGLQPQERDLLRALTRGMDAHGGQR